VKTAHELVGADYSRDFAAMFAFKNMFPLYKELGHLRASFGRPQATVENTGECKQGVAVTIPVEEGSIYIWDGAEWTGNQGIPAEQLTKEIKMKAGEVANGLKFDEGIAGALKLYRRKGRLDATIRPQATFDDVARKVSFTLDVKEGPEYHMGQITVKGFSDVLGNYLRGKWELLHDDVFNEGYFEDFLKNQFSEVIMKVKEERQAQGRPAPKKVNASTQAHRDTLTVDVTFEIGDDKPTP
jgi:outer membrane protein assembly factor BamA